MNGRGSVMVKREVGKSNSARIASKLRRNQRDARSHHLNRGECQPDDGFTLVELLIVMIVLPLIMGAIGVSLLAIFKNQSVVSNRLTSSGDAQVVSASYYPDLQSSAQLTTQTSSSPQCGSGRQVIGLGWQDSAGSLTLVSYTVFSTGSINGVTSWGLQRSLCTGVSASQTGTVNPLSVTTLATNVPSSNVVPVATGLSCSVATGVCSSAAAMAAAGWASAVGVQSVKLTINDVGTSGSGGWSFALGSGPREWLPLTTSCLVSVTCVAGWWIPGPSALLDVRQSGGNNKLNGICNINVPSLGLNSATVTVDGNNSNLYTGLSRTTIYGSNGQKINTHQGKLSTVNGTFSDPFAGLTPATLTSTSIPGFPTIVDLGTTWPSEFIGGTIYVIDNSKLPRIGMPATGPNGSTSVLIWDTISGTLSLNGNSTTNLGPNGILYAPNAILKFDGGSQLIGSNVILNSMTCDGGGHRAASLILTAHS